MSVTYNSAKFCGNYCWQIMQTYTKQYFMLTYQPYKY